MPSSIVIKFAKLLADHKLTVSVVESATAGRLAYELSQTEYAGSILKGGIVCYDACIKQDLMGIPKNLIDKFTPESAEVTKAITHALGKIIPADIYIGVTGLPKAGGSETDEKPVGTMFVHILFQGLDIADRSEFSGGSETVIEKCVNRIAELIIENVERNLFWELLKGER